MHYLYIWKNLIIISKEVSNLMLTKIRGGLRKNMQAANSLEKDERVF